MTPPVPPGWKCPRRVGFLFPHPCERLSPIGCPDCQNGQLDDPYLSYQRYSYSRWDYYDDSYYSDYGYHSSSYPDEGYAISQGVASDVTVDAPTDVVPADFTEADGADMVQPDDDGFEDSMTES